MHPNRILPLTVLTGLIALTSASTFAAETGDMTIQGTIRPAACNVTLSDDGLIDLGTVAAMSLGQSAATMLPDREFDLTVVCDSAARVAIHSADGHHTKEQSDALTLLGTELQRGAGVTSDDGTSVGAMTLMPGAATADGAAAAAVVTTNNTTSWGALSLTAPIMTDPSSDDYTGWAPVGSTTPGAFTSMGQHFTVRTALGPKSKLPSLATDVGFNGLVTFDIRYL